MPVDKTIRAVIDTNIVIQSAIEGNADYIVTSNIKDFSRYYSTKDGRKGQTIRPGKFLDILGIRK